MPRRFGPGWIAVALLVTGACDDVAPVPLVMPVAPVAPADASSTYIGNYAMTLNVGERCALPENVRTRTYTATIESKPREPNRSATMVVTLNDAKFRQGCGNNMLSPGLGCNQFVASTEDDRIRFFLPDPDWGEGGHIWELLPVGDLLIAGGASGRLEGATIEASGKADVFYCSGAPQDSASGCTRTYCGSNDVRLTFTRR